MIPLFARVGSAVALCLLVSLPAYANPSRRQFLLSGLGLCSLLSRQGAEALPHLVPASPPLGSERRTVYLSVTGPLQERHGLDLLRLTVRQFLESLGETDENKLALLDDIQLTEFWRRVRVRLAEAGQAPGAFVMDFDYRLEITPRIVLYLRPQWFIRHSGWSRPIEVDYGDGKTREPEITHVALGNGASARMRVDALWPGRDTEPIEPVAQALGRLHVALDRARATPVRALEQGTP